MKCPFCDGSLVAEGHAGIEIDRCARCASLWFDRDELIVYLPARTGSRGDSFEISPEPGSAFLACPRCTAETLYACRVANIAARHCSGCGGIALEAKAVPGAARLGGYSVGDGAVDALLWGPEVVDSGDSIAEAVIEFLSGIFDLMP